MKEIFIVETDEGEKRLDVFLNENLSDFTRSQIKKSIEEGKTLINGKSSKAGKVIKVGDKIEFESVDNEITFEPENIPINIVYEDEDLAVINKSQGMTVHPAPGNYSGTLVNALIYHFDNISNVGGDVRPGIVHRIDKDTSGLLLVAKNNKAHLSLAEQISRKTCHRIYYALVEGIVKEDKGTIKTYIGRSSQDRKKMAVVNFGKEAITHYEVLERFNENTLVKFKLETGRTHQIRVHSKHIGHPIVGDKTYGFKNQKFNLDGQLLHAKQIVFRHPSTNKEMSFEVDLPDYFEHVLTVVRNKAKNC